MDKQQWQDLARFAGVECRHYSRRTIFVGGTGSAEWTSKCADCGAFNAEWRPDTDWNDFGPLWMKLEKHLFDFQVSGYPEISTTRFLNAQQHDDAQELMLAGCELGAAIGAAMRQQEEVKSE